ncbi:LOW QUALITY PROTEIN: hypothetical protein HID58_095216, partial [Brassica napus]
THRRFEHNNTKKVKQNDGVSSESSLSRPLFQSLHRPTPTSSASSTSSTTTTFPGRAPPNWLNTALLRSENNFLNLHTTAANAPPRAAPTLLPPPPPSPLTSGCPAPPPSSNAPQTTTTTNAAASVVGDVIDDVTGGGAEQSSEGGENRTTVEEEEKESWQNARAQGGDPLSSSLRAASVGARRVSENRYSGRSAAEDRRAARSYSTLGGGGQGLVGDDKELDQFMSICAASVFFQRATATAPVMACWEIEQSLQSLNRLVIECLLVKEWGATMSDDEENNERSLMVERVRQELKHELKQGLQGEDSRHKRGDTEEEKSWEATRRHHLCSQSMLWQYHSKWPYPTEDKAGGGVVQETGLQLKQINNWFINQRKGKLAQQSISSLS